MIEDEAMRLLCNAQTMVAKEAAEDVTRGDVVYFDFKNRIRRARTMDHAIVWATYYALNDASAGESVTIFGTDWPR